MNFVSINKPIGSELIFPHNAGHLLTWKSDYFRFWLKIYSDAVTSRYNSSIIKM